MLKFKIGDKVRLKSGILPNEYNYIYLTDRMIQDINANDYVTISNIHNYSRCCLLCSNSYEWWVGENALELYKENDTYTLCGFEGKINKCYNNKHKSILYFLDFYPNHNDACLHISEELYKIGKSLNTLGEQFCQKETGLFPEFDSCERLYSFLEFLSLVLDGKKEPITNKTKNNNEIRFQKPKASIIGGFVPKGHQICGRKHKTAIVVGRLSNRTCYC